MSSTNILIRPNSNNLESALSHIDRVWAEFYPLAPAKPVFLDDFFIENYAILGAFGNIFAALALFSFTISSIGLIGMATFITSLRKREIGIRKILGANRKRILKVLLMDFSKPVIIANLIGWPLGFIMAKAYLSIFSVKIAITLTPFLISFVIIVATTIFAMFSQAFKGSKIRPASVLKYE